MSTLEHKPLQGRHAIVTGGARGIGSSIAKSLDDLGANVTLMGRSMETLSARCQELSNARPVAVDVRDESSVKTAFTQARESYGPINILVNNAGAATSSALHQTGTDDWHYMLDVNLTGVFYCCREAIPDMRENRWGRVINIASIAGLSGAAYISAYCAAKHGVIGLTRALAMELARLNITVNALCPGYTNTDLLEGAIDNIVKKTALTRQEAQEQLKAASPQHRFIEPEEVAASTAWLCLPGSEGITGQAISITGGGTQA